MRTMSTTAHVESDGWIHVQAFPDLAGQEAEVLLVAEPRRPSTPISDIEERRSRIKAALRYLHELGLPKGESDPAEWQRQEREDRPLPGRA